MIEIAYLAPFLGVDDTKKTTLLRYKKLNGQEDTHKLSKDKLKHVNCYDTLEPGRSYIIFTENKNPAGNGRGRWIWVMAYDTPPSLIGKVYNQLKAMDTTSTLPGYKVTSQEMFERAAIAVLMKHRLEEQAAANAKLIDELFDFGSSAPLR